MTNDENTDFQKELFEKINKLPSLPQLVQKLQQVVTDPNSRIEDIEEILKLDPVIISKILRLANSAYIGLPKTVSSLKNAIVVLGMKRIQSLVITNSLLSSLKVAQTMPFDQIRFWKHSVTVSMVSESIARHMKRYEFIDVDEIFIAGILHDIGKIALTVFKPEIISEAYKKAKTSNTPFYQNEVSDRSHSFIGSLVMKHWNFPPNLCHAIQYHHQPRTEKLSSKIEAIIHLSDVMTHMVGLGTTMEEVIPPIDEGAVGMIGLEPERLRVIAYSCLKKEKQVESLIAFVA